MWQCYFIFRRLRKNEYRDPRSSLKRIAILSPSAWKIKIKKSRRSPPSPPPSHRPARDENENTRSSRRDVHRRRVKHDTRTETHLLSAAAKRGKHKVRAGRPAESARQSINAARAAKRAPFRRTSLAVFDARRRRDFILTFVAETLPDRSQRRRPQVALVRRSNRKSTKKKRETARSRRNVLHHETVGYRAPIANM